MTSDEIYNAIVKELGTNRSADFNHLIALCPKEFTDGDRVILAPPPAENILIWQKTTVSAEKALLRFVNGPGHIQTVCGIWGKLAYMTGGHFPRPAAGEERSYEIQKDALGSGVPPP